MLPAFQRFTLEADFTPIRELVERSMPWDPKDASRHTKKANTPSKKRQFAEVANKVLAETGDEGRAVRAGNAAVRNHPSKKRTKS